jgi:SAM-dependent methyltransferase
VNHRDHVALLRAAVAGVPDAGARWLELGSGEGAFTLALADLLGPGATIHSVDLDAGALRRQRQELASRFPAAGVTYQVGDFTRDRGLPGGLDGILMANSLHYVGAQEDLLRRLIAHLRPGGRLVLVEYDADQPNRWVPYPLSYRTWEPMAARVGLVATRRTGAVPSRFLGSIYSAASERPESRAVGPPAG